MRVSVSSKYLQTDPDNLFWIWFQALESLDTSQGSWKTRHHIPWPNVFDNVKKNSITCNGPSKHCTFPASFFRSSPEAKEQPATYFLKYLICNGGIPEKSRQQKRSNKSGNRFALFLQLDPLDEGGYFIWFYMPSEQICSSSSIQIGRLVVHCTILLNKCAFKFKQFVLNIKKCLVLGTHSFYPPLPLRKVSLFSIAWAVGHVAGHRVFNDLL